MNMASFLIQLMADRECWFNYTMDEEPLLLRTIALAEDKKTA